ncbi:hypothetical protein COP2_044845 [Malus domestica]
MSPSNLNTPSIPSSSGSSASLKLPDFKQSPVYLVDFSCYKPEDSRKVTRRVFMNSSHSIGTFTEENLAFQRKILERSGLGDSTYLPEAVVQVPPNPCMAEARTQNSDYVFN